MTIRMQLKRPFIFFFVGVLALALNACGSAGTDTETTEAEGEGGEETAAEGGGSELSGEILVDGSSTVFPISEAMAEEFMAANPDVRVTVGTSGSGGGFKKFCAGETDVSNASRPIKEEEIQLCEENGIEYVEVPVAFDGLSVIVNDENDWVECFTPDELKTVWEPEAEGEITNWNQVRDEFPDQELGLYAPGVDSGTFDYFTEAIVGEGGASRGDYTASEDDNVIVQGVQSDVGGHGFLGYAYYEENKDSLKVVAIENSAGECVEPSGETIADGTYNPLSRPLFIYASTSSLEEKPQVKAFMEFHLNPENEQFISETGYVALPDTIIEKAQTRLEEGVTGSIYEGGSSVGVKLEEQL